MEEQIILAKFIEVKRKEMGLTQTQAAQLIGLPRTTYQDREKGISLDVKFLRDFSERVLSVSFIEFISRYEYFLQRREIQL